MHCRTDLAEEMRTTRFRVESRSRLPIQPADVMLLRHEQQRLTERLVPGAQNLTRNPRMGELADGENAQGFGAKQHQSPQNSLAAPNRRSRCHATVHSP